MSEKKRMVGRGREGRGGDGMKEGTGNGKEGQEEKNGMEAGRVKRKMEGKEGEEKNLKSRKRSR